MKKVAIIISKIPHGSSFGREALDAALALSSYNRISLFFIGDGVFHLLRNQVPSVILMRDYISAFGLLELYDIDKCYACIQDLETRHVSNPIIDVIKLDKHRVLPLLAEQNSILHF